VFDCHDQESAQLFKAPGTTLPVNTKKKTSALVASPQVVPMLLVEKNEELYASGAPRHLRLQHYSLQALGQHHKQHDNSTKHLGRRMTLTAVCNIVELSSLR